MAKKFTAQRTDWQLLHTVCDEPPCPRIGTGTTARADLVRLCFVEADNVARDFQIKTDARELSDEELLSIIQAFISLL